MVAVLVHHCVDDYFIRHEALIDDPVRERRSHHALLGTGFAGALLALDYLHEILGRLHVENFADFVADHLRDSAAVTALALLRRADNDLLHAGKIGGQCLAAGMRTPLLFLLLIFRRAGQRLAFALRNYFNVAYAGFKFQQFQLQVAELLAAGTVLRDSMLAHLLQGKCSTPPSSSPTFSVGNRHFSAITNSSSIADGLNRMRVSTLLRSGPELGFLSVILCTQPLWFILPFRSRGRQIGKRILADSRYRWRLLRRDVDLDNLRFMNEPVRFVDH